MSRRGATAVAMAVLAVASGAFLAWGRPEPGGAPRLASTALPRVLPQPYRADADATVEIEHAFQRAFVTGRRVIVDLGANWCPDCRALAGMFQLPEFKRLLGERYEHVYVDVNRFERNAHVVKALGIDDLNGIPTVLIFSPERRLLNRATSEEWHDAATRNPQQAFNYFWRWSR